MTRPINGTASAMQNLSGSLQIYNCFVKSPGCFTDPNPNPPASQSLMRLINIQVTSELSDESQRNFDVFLMSIAMRAMPVVLTDPLAVLDLAVYTNELFGEGFVWQFTVERNAQFYNFKPYGTPGPVGLLIDDMDGIYLPSGVRVTTVNGSPTGIPKNTAFTKG